MKILDFVQFNATNGSIGRIIEETIGSYNRKKYMVRWFYGLDVKGKPMTAISRHVDPLNLKKVSRQTFIKNSSKYGF